MQLFENGQVIDVVSSLTAPLFRDLTAQAGIPSSCRVSEDKTA